MQEHKLMPKLIGGVKIDPLYAECRAYGHSWDTTDVRFPTAWIEHTMTCQRCDTVRVDRVERGTGFIKGRKYKHAPGYIRKGEAPIGRNELGQFRLYMLKGGNS